MLSWILLLAACGGGGGSGGGNGGAGQPPVQVDAIRLTGTVDASLAAPRVVINDDIAATITGTSWTATVPLAAAGTEISIAWWDGATRVAASAYDIEQRASPPSEVGDPAAYEPGTGPVGLPGDGCAGTWEDAAGYRLELAVTGTAVSGWYGDGFGDVGVIAGTVSNGVLALTATLAPQGGRFGQFGTASVPTVLRIEATLAEGVLAGEIRRAWDLAAAGIPIALIRTGTAVPGGQPAPSGQTVLTWDRLARIPVLDPLGVCYQLIGETPNVMIHPQLSWGPGAISGARAVSLAVDWGDGQQARFTVDDSWKWRTPSPVGNHAYYWLRHGYAARGDYTITCTSTDAAGVQTVRQETHHARYRWVPDLAKALPVITSITPRSGAGGEPLVIRGRNFASDSWVHVGGNLSGISVANADVVVVSSTELHCTIPRRTWSAEDGDAVKVGIRVVSEGCSSASGQAEFTYLRPEEPEIPDEFAGIAGTSTFTSAYSDMTAYGFPAAGGTVAVEIDPSRGVVSIAGREYTYVGIVQEQQAYDWVLYFTRDEADATLELALARDSSWGEPGHDLVSVWLFPDGGEPGGYTGTALLRGDFP